MEYCTQKERKLVDFMRFFQKKTDRRTPRLNESSIEFTTRFETNIVGIKTTKPKCFEMPRFLHFGKFSCLVAWLRPVRILPLFILRRNHFCSKACLVEVV